MEDETNANDVSILEVSVALKNRRLQDRDQGNKPIRTNNETVKLDLL